MDRDQNVSLKRYFELEGIGAPNSDCRIIDPKTGAVLETVPAILFDEPMSKYMKAYRAKSNGKGRA